MEKKEKIIQVLQGVLLLADGVSKKELVDLFEDSVYSKSVYIYKFLDSYFIKVEK